MNHPKTDEAIMRIEKKQTHSGAHNVTTNYKAAFIELGFEMAELETSLRGMLARIEVQLSTRTDKVIQKLLGEIRETIS